MTMGVDVTKQPTGVERESRHDSRPPALKSKGPTRRLKRRPKRPRGLKRQSMAADDWESRGIVLAIVGQS